MQLGFFEIDDFVTFTCNTHDPTTAAEADADSVPTYRVYEDETGTPILTGSMAKLDDTNTLGFYSEQIQLTAANGFEAGKSYNIRIAATVGSVSGVTIRNLQVTSVTAAPTAAAIADAVWDEATTGHTTSGTFGEQLKTNVDAILVDTGTTLDGKIDTIDTVVDAILADTGTDGVVVAAGSKTGYSLAADQSSVTIGTVNALGATAKADVNAEVDTALTDIHLDHLLAADYDPASKPGTATALLNELVESDAGVSRFTANALEQAPAGGGGGTADWTADEKTAIKSILGIPASGTAPEDPTVGILDTIRDKVDTVDDLLDTEVAAIKSDTTAILADTGTDGVVVAAASKTGYTLSSAGIQAIWDALTSALSTASSIGKLLVDNINATISSRASQTSVDTIDTNVDSVLADTGTDGVVVAAGSKSGYSLAADQSGVTVGTVNALGTQAKADVNAEADTALTDVGLTSARTAKLDALPTRLRKNTAFANFQFLMVDETDHLSGKTGLTVTAQRVIDNGSLAACTNTPTEIGNGLYRIDLSASDLNGDIVTLLFTATGADARVVTAILQEAA